MKYEKIEKFLLRGIDVAFPPMKVAMQDAVTPIAKLHIILENQGDEEHANFGPNRRVVVYCGDDWQERAEEEEKDGDFACMSNKLRNEVGFGSEYIFAIYSFTPPAPPTIENAVFKPNEHLATTVESAFVKPDEHLMTLVGFTKDDPNVWKDLIKIDPVEGVTLDMVAADYEFVKSIVPKEEVVGRKERRKFLAARKPRTQVAKRTWEIRPDLLMNRMSVKDVFFVERTFGRRLAEPGIRQSNFDHLA